MFGLYKDPFTGESAKIFQPPTLDETYRSILKEHSVYKINRIIENCSYEDAASVYERFFLDCKQRIKIVTCEVDSRIFDHDRVLNAVRRFFINVDAVCELHTPALSEDEKQAVLSTKFFSVGSYSGQDRGRFSWKCHNTPKDKFIPDHLNISLGDGRMYRNSTRQTDSSSLSCSKADVNFNDPECVKSLEEIVSNSISDDTATL